MHPSTKLTIYALLIIIIIVGAQFFFPLYFLSFFIIVGIYSHTKKVRNLHKDYL